MQHLSYVSTNYAILLVAMPRGLSGDGFVPEDLKMQKPSKATISHNKVIAKTVVHKEMPSQPNVIARLMGIDAIPTPAKDAVMIRGEESSNPKPPNAREIKVTPPRSAPFKQSKFSLLSYRGSIGDPWHCHRNTRTGRARSRRHHPQEEQLQKFKEDFQAWQASLVLESTRTVAALGNSRPRNGRYIQILAQEKLHNEKMARYAHGSKNVTENMVLPQNVTHKDHSKHANNTEEQSEERVIKVLRVSHCSVSEKFRDFEVGKDEHSCSTCGRSRSPTQIVILKPSSDKGVDGRETWLGSSKVRRDCNMEAFLAEMKERLTKELQGRATREATMARPSLDPKQLARDIAKQIRETVTKDLGRRLSRSESFRAFRGDGKRNATTGDTSPEHVRIDTKKILTNQRKSVLGAEATPPDRHGEASSDPFPIRSRTRVRSMADISLSDIGLAEAIRDKIDDKVSVNENAASPRILVRSFSAPACGASPGRLFPEDNVGKNSSFSLRGRVSNLRHSFSLRGKLFGRKTHWSKKPSIEEFHPLTVIGTTPSPPRNFGVRQDNFTELPPSPVSPLEVEGNSSRHFFGDSNRTLPELSPKSSSESDAAISVLSYKTDTETNHEMAYIREVLRVAGLCDDGSLNSKANARVGSMARPISDDVFEEAEEAYYCRGNKVTHDHGDTVLYSNAEEGAMDRRMLFDLANEALQSLVGSLMAGSSLRRWVVNSSGLSRGRKLVHDVWHQVQILRSPPMQEMQTIDGMVAREVWTSAWLQVLYEDVYVVGRKIERAIFDELIGDIVQEILV